MMKRLPVGATLIAGSLLCLSVTAEARQYLGFSQPGTPDSWAWQLYPTFQPSSGGNSAYMYANLNYFTKTGFTGTTQDQWQFYAGGNFGYAATSAPGSSGFGIAGPEIGAEYYYNLVPPTTPVGSPGYHTIWVSPYLNVIFPNGDTQTSGYGNGSDQYGLSGSVEAFFQWGNFILTFQPLYLGYNFENLNTTVLSNGAFVKQRGGLSLIIADTAVGFNVTPDLAIGIAHQFNYNNVANSTLQHSSEGIIGPTMTYAGFAKINLFFGVALQTDYYRENQAHNSYLTAWITKQF